MRDRYGLHGLIIASGVMYKGLAQYLGMSFHKAKDTRDPGHDIARRIEHAADLVNDFDFIHVHTKAPDQAAHTKNPKAKVKAIESLDRGLTESIDSLLNNDDVLLAITADHSTPSCGTMIHSGEPVPLMFVGGGVRRDNVKSFDEISVAGGSLGSMRGDEMMYMILNYLDKARLIGIHDTPMKQEFWPGDYNPLLIEDC
jgi:2,3-bisphosphoglycerate-independent phosphoglycerate mutase